MMVFFFSVTRLEVSNMFIAALLSIIGYSINDTIVAFDKIRENLKSCKVGSQIWYDLEKKKYIKGSK